jgi:PAS domain S-box-containing protein
MSPPPSTSASSTDRDRNAVLFVQYALPVLLVAAAFLPTLWVEPILERSTFLLFTAAVVAAATLGGLRAGLVSTFLSVAGAIAILHPRGRAWIDSRDDVVRLVMFVVVSLWVSVISERTRRLWRQTESHARELRRSEESYRRIVDLADEGIWSLDADGATLFVNRRLTQMLGYSADQMRGQRLFGFVAPEQREDGRRLWEGVHAGATRRGELAFRRRDGEAVWARVACTPMIESGRFDGAVAMLTDVSAQKRDRETLEQSESLLRAVIDGTTDVVFVKDLEGRYLLINPAGASALGRPASDVVGRTDGELMPQEVAGEIAGHERRVASGELPDTFEYTIGEGAAARFFSATVAPHRDARGRVVGVLGIARDVTERKRVDEERAALLAETETARRDAEAANRAKDEFLATLSHELRTPLTSIVGWAKMLRSGQLDADTTARAIETIDRNARLQTQLIADVLDLSRIVSGKLRLNPRPTELAPTVEAALDTVRPAAEAKGIRIRRALDRFPCPVSGDSDRLQQVVWNLLSNAIKFTPQNGVVEVRLECRGREAEIVVTDTGIGISPELLPHVFERFRQGDASSTRSYGGLGLGLAIVRHMVELHGGRVEAESPGLGMGATFRVRLPLLLDTTTPLPAEVDRRRPAERPAPPTLPGPSLAGITVLVVDDEADARELVAMVLGHAGAKVLTASSAAHALELVQSAHPDVLLSDLEMPQESGYALIKKVRALPPQQGGRIPAAALTAYARLEDRTRALRAGFQMHIPKPLNPAELAAIVASLAGRLQEA